MTNQQFQRWQDFAMRMARTCFARRRRPNSRWICEVVGDFFDMFDKSVICCLVDWDNSQPYPEGHSCRRQDGTSSCMCKYPDGYMKPRSPVPDCEWCSGSGRAPRWVSPYCVGSMVSEFLSERRGYAPDCLTCTTHRYAPGQPGCFCEKIEDLYYEQWDEQWGGPVHCCIRAGLDCASSPSAGVIGFTAGDVRRMYPEGVPDWVFPPGERLRYWLSDELNGTFEQLPDSAGVML